MSGVERIFVGRAAELARWEEILWELGGSVAVVIGPPGMGKTALLDKIQAVTTSHAELTCGAVRYEVTESDTPDVVMDLMMKNAFAAATVEEGSLDITERRARQWKALFKAAKLDGVAELAASLRHDPARPIREQFLARLEMVSKRLPEHGRAVFLLDPEKMMAAGSADGWRLLFKDLPEKIKFVVAQRPQDALAESSPTGEIWQLPNVELLTPDGGALEPLGSGDVDEWADAAAASGVATGSLRGVLARYAGHPFAIDAAVRLLRDSRVTADQLPDRPEPTLFAAEQWRVLRAEHGADAIRLVEALAVLEVAAPREAVLAVSTLDRPALEALCANPFIGGLVREEDGRLRLYHALFQEHVAKTLEEAGSDRDAYHRRAIAWMRERLKEEKPGVFAAERLWRHVEAVDGLPAGMEAFVNECTEALKLRGSLATAERDGSRMLQKLPEEKRGTSQESAILGNLANVLRIRGKLTESRDLYEKSIKISITIGDDISTAIGYSQLGILLRQQGDISAARALQREALAINTSLGNSRGLSSDYTNLGIISMEQGELLESKMLHTKALQASIDCNWQVGIATAHGNIGNILKLEGKLDDALVEYRKCLDIGNRIGAQQIIASSYGNLAEIYINKEEFELAEDLLLSTLKLDEQVGDQAGVAQDYVGLALVRHGKGDYDGSRDALLRAESIYQQLGLEHMLSRLNRLKKRLADL